MQTKLNKIKKPELIKVVLKAERRNHELYTVNQKLLKEVGALKVKEKRMETIVQNAISEKERYAVMVDQALKLFKLITKTVDGK